MHQHRRGNISGPKVYLLLKDKGQTIWGQILEREDRLFNRSVNQVKYVQVWGPSLNRACLIFKMLLFHPSPGTLRPLHRSTGKATSNILWLLHLNNSLPCLLSNDSLSYSYLLHGQGSNESIQAGEDPSPGWQQICGILPTAFWFEGFVIELHPPLNLW